MKPEIMQAFVSAAHEVLMQEMGEPVEPRRISLQGGPYKTREVTVIIGLAQDIEGAVILSMSKQTAVQYVARVIGEAIDELDELAQSGIGELGNVIAGRAGVVLGEKGFQTVIAPPAIILGHETTLSTLALQRLVLPVETPLGVVELQLAAKEKK